MAKNRAIEPAAIIRVIQLPAPTMYECARCGVAAASAEVPLIRGGRAICPACASRIQKKANDVFITGGSRRHAGAIIQQQRRRHMSNARPYRGPGFYLSCSGVAEASWPGMHAPAPQTQMGHGVSMKAKSRRKTKPTLDPNRIYAARREALEALKDAESNYKAAAGGKLDPRKIYAARAAQCGGSGK